MEECFSGKKLRRDDFTPAQIKEWFASEQEGYASIIKEYEEPFATHYRTHRINSYYLWRHLPSPENGLVVLGIGSAYGAEFDPIRERISELYILEPSEEFVKYNSAKQKYIKPSFDGKLDFPNGSFDLVVCLGVLHHIPNVTFVVNEIYRCLKPGGHFLTREPIFSMGDWTQPRVGLTRNERGIPIGYFRKMVKKAGFKTIQENFLFTGTWLLVRLTKKFLKKEFYEYKGWILFDQILSFLFRWNIHYHPGNKFQRIFPTSVSFVLKK